MLLVLPFFLFFLMDDFKEKSFATDYTDEHRFFFNNISRLYNTFVIPSLTGYRNALICKLLTFHRFTIPVFTGMTSNLTHAKHFYHIDT